MRELTATILTLCTLLGAGIFLATHIVDGLLRLLHFKLLLAA